MVRYEWRAHGSTRISMGVPSYQVPSTNGPPKVCHFSEVDMALHVHAWGVPMRFGCQPGEGDMRSFGDASEMQGDASCYM
jgi:hypothetical protein